MNISIPVENSCEFINVIPVNPLISKCQIKVCYVQDNPNRNGSVITKEVGKKLAQSLPGSPIVGFYNETKEDFEEHNKLISISNGEIKITSNTFPYGFVDMNPKIWFQKFLDGENKEEHEYLMTEGYIWTGQYPESKRIIEKGNNQSMELDDNFLDASWTKDDNGKLQFFIINEAIISKLCILGEDVEPCFEGAQITKVQYSLQEDFKEQLLKMKNELEEIVEYERRKNKVDILNYAVELGGKLWDSIYNYLCDKYPEDDYCSEYRLSGIYEENNSNKFAVISSRKDGSCFRLNFSFGSGDEIIFEDKLIPVKMEFIPVSNISKEEIVAYEQTFATKRKMKKEEEEETNKNTSDEKNSKNESKTNDKSDSKDNSAQNQEEDPEKKKKKQYSLEEYETIFSELSNLKTIYSELLSKYKGLEEENQALIEFKNKSEKKDKQNMIDSFYMLSDEDKKDVIDNIDTYSLNDIEAKLSILCVRNKVNFNLDKEDSYSFNIDQNEEYDDTPAWIKAVKEYKDR